jgi:hypothetical protein
MRSEVVLHETVRHETVRTKEAVRLKFVETLKGVPTDV